MKTPFLLCLLLLALCVGSARAANATLTNFNATYFEVDPNPHAIPTNVIKTKMPSVYINTGVTNLYVTNLFVTNLYATTIITTNPIVGDAVWTNELGIIHPHVVNSMVLATNIVRAGNGVMAGTESWFCKSQILTNGVNYLDAAEHSIFQLISPSTIPSNVQIVLSNGIGPLQWLDLFNLTNAVPSQGAFILTNNTPIPDSLASGVVQLCNQEDWVSTNGCGIRLLFIPPNWVEQYRMDVSGNPTFVTNTFNYLTVISNTTLRGRITVNNVSITTNTLWTTNVVAGTVNLHPVDDSVAVSTPNALFIGGNSLLHYAGMGAADDIVSWKNTTNGATEHSISLQSRWDAANITGRFVLDGDTNNFSILSSVIGNDGQGYGFQWGVGDGNNTIMETKQNNSVVGWSMRPGEVDGSTTFKLGTYTTHTTGNLFELANNTTNKLTLDYDGKLSLETGMSNYVYMNGANLYFKSTNTFPYYVLRDLNNVNTLYGINSISAFNSGGTYQIYAAAASGGDGPTAIQLENLATTHMLIPVTPNVQLGYTATSYQWEGSVVSTRLRPSIFWGYLTNTGSAGVELNHTGTNGSVIFNSTSTGDAGAARDMHFQTNGVDLAVINTDKTLSVGSTNRWQLLSVTEGASTNITIKVNGKTYTFQAW